MEIADRETFNVLWPAGYRARGQPLEIIDASGAVIAHEGDMVSFGIGDIRQGPLPGCPERRTILAMEINQVDGQDLHSPTPFVDRPILR